MVDQSRVGSFRSMMLKLSVPAILGLIVTVALALRLYGIGWGLPDLSHLEYSYEPDEALMYVWGEMLTKGKIIAKHFQYGGTLYYSTLNAFSRFGESLSGYLGGVNIFSDGILFGRYFLVGVALVTLLLIFETGRLLFNKNTGLWSAAFIAIAPAHIVWAQRVRPDELAALLTALILFAAAKLLHAPQAERRLYLYAGIAVGVATALRMPLLVFGVAPVVAHLIRSSPKNVGQVAWSLLDWRMLAFGISVPIAFLLASPHVLMYPKAFLAGLSVPLIYQHEAFPDAIDRGPVLFQYAFRALPQALGYALYALAAAGLVLALVKRTAADIIILCMVVAYFFLFTLTVWIVVRYTLPLLPMLAILAGRFVQWLLESFPRRRMVTFCALGSVLAWTLIADLAFLRVQAGENIRDEASAWLSQNLEKGTVVASAMAYRGDVYFLPPVPASNRKVQLVLSKEEASAAIFDRHERFYVTISQYIYKDVDRLGGRHPIKGYVDFLALLRTRCKLLREFNRPVEFLGIDFSSSFDAFDYAVVNPGIRVYQCFSV